MFKNKWKRWGIILFTIVVLVGLVVLANISHLLVKQSDIQHADAIIVISGGRGERVDHAVELYKQGFADTLIISGCPQKNNSIAEAHIMQETAVEKGVPEGKILLDVLESHGQGTGVQAVNIRKIIEQHGFDNVILVTTDFHTARSKMIFERAFNGMDINLQIDHPQTGVFDGKSWWTNSRKFKIVIFEVVKYIWYWISY